PIVWPPSATATPSSSSTTGGSSRKAATTSSWPRACSSAAWPPIGPTHRTRPSMPADPVAPSPAPRFELGGRVVGAGRTLVVAEIGQAHDGSLGLAHAFVDAVAEA